MGPQVNVRMVVALSSLALENRPFATAEAAKPDHHCDQMMRDEPLQPRNSTSNVSVISPKAATARLAPAADDFAKVPPSLARSGDDRTSFA